MACAYKKSPFPIKSYVTELTTVTIRSDFPYSHLARLNSPFLIGRSSGQLSHSDVRRVFSSIPQRFVTLIIVQDSKGTIRKHVDVSAMASSIVAVLLLLVVSTSASAPYECLDPPGNGPIADVVVNVLNASRSFIGAGIPSLGIPPLDPLGPFPHIGFHIDTDGVRMDFQLNHTLVMNMAQFIICQLNVTVGIKQKFDIDLRLDNFHIEGLYDLDGIVAFIFPVYGAGNYRIDVMNGGIYGGGKLALNVFTKRLSLSSFDLDVFFDALEVELDAVLGGGDMADLVNSVINVIAPPMFDAIWGVMRPILTEAIEDGINEILSKIPIGDQFLDGLEYEYTY
ncbi:uncharacterized protein LOC135200772 isoform X2 [Macrobrachium nipponense]|uniref:uncharacterized protein LOC135200772 isoform X2 n=1 Tax=Macrobrachium nipponense TaxID=159736 RepID=UPI0030C7A5E6